MFGKGRQAKKKLNAKDLGEIQEQTVPQGGEDIIKGYLLHRVCHTRLRLGRDNETGDIVHWCSKCEKVSSRQSKT